MGKTICGTNYPLSICFVVVNEFCERFSYYGMKALLTIYFVTYLDWDADLSTAVYHAFSGLCYFTPILGAVIADSWLGKFKTIIYLSLVYVIGHVVKSVGAIPTVGSKDAHIALSMLGLILIAFGTGGIKPCVAAFGGDQFEEEHVRERQKFFSIFYMSINAGSLLSTVITPILRNDVKCFGGDCYALAFGVPAILMIVALVVFIAGSGMYKKNPPQGNIMLEVCNCIGFAITNRVRRYKFDPPRKHWLDWAEEKYSKRLIQETKMVLRVLVLYIPLPMFWALFDQQGSRWTLQATRMNMAFGNSFTIKPDQMQMLNALLILLFVPIFDLIIYPLVSLCGINITPLRKMAAGMIFAALAFGAATLVEVDVVRTVVIPAPAQKSLLQVYNLAGGNVSLNVPDSDPASLLFPETVSPFQDPSSYQTLPLGAASKQMMIEVQMNGKTSQCNVLFEEKKTYSLILYAENAGIQCKLYNYILIAEKIGMRDKGVFFSVQAEDYTQKSETGSPFVRFLNTGSEVVTVRVGRTIFTAGSGYGLSLNETVERREYQFAECCSASGNCSNLSLGLLDFGASYTFILLEKSGKVETERMVDVEANDVHIAWQIPQYALITAGEVMFSITGLEFSYSQAPANMKSVLQAGWLLTVAFGNVIVLIVAEGAGLDQWMEFILFAALLLGVCIIFSIMANFYTYVDPEQIDKMHLDDLKKEEDDDDDSKEKKKHNDVVMNKAGKTTRM